MREAEVGVEDDGARGRGGEDDVMARENSFAAERGNNQPTLHEERGGEERRGGSREKTRSNRTDAAPLTAR